MSPAFLLELSLRGSLAFLGVAVFDLAFGTKMRVGWRRVWWLLIPLAFLLPMALLPDGLSFKVSPHGVPPEMQAALPDGLQLSDVSDVAERVVVYHPTLHLASFSASSWIILAWWAGVAVTLTRVVIATIRTGRTWSRPRLSTDPVLLDLLENAKATAGVTAPIGLVVSGEIAAPALLGWLRPRILLPRRFTECPQEELHAVLLHELAHFKHLDIPANWLFTAVRVVHWFNPLAWLAAAQWNRFREEAADEQAIRWLNEPSGAAYGEILLTTLRNCSGGGAPYGALAIGESVNHLKRRILMIHHHASKTNRGAIGALVIVLLGALTAFSPMLAVAADTSDDTSKKAAVDAMQGWLAESDAGHYSKMWTDSAKSFQKAVTSDQWVAAATNVRKPLGKLVSRQLATSMLQTSTGAGGTPKGTFVIAQFATSFENLKSALETVTFQKESDGAWRAAGYYIKPG